MWADLISSYGYWILAIGCLLEGETVLLLAGFAARSGRLDPLAVFVIAAVCGFAGDEIAYWIGRRHGGWLLARWPLLARRSRRVRALLERRHALAIVMLRFAYGLRLAGPVVIGMTDVPPWRFVTFNALGALLWAAAIGALGWTFGEAAHRLLGRLHHFEGWLFALLLAAALLARGLAHWRRSRRGD
ncbi:MAG: DedA family protein [Burkholderiales bacterium]|nr:DedA family protein [Burkholderiales bacterium]